MTKFLKYDFFWCEFVYSLLSSQILLVYTVGTSGQKLCIVLIVHFLKEETNGSMNKGNQPNGGVRICVINKVLNFKNI